MTPFSGVGCMCENEVTRWQAKSTGHVAFQKFKQARGTNLSLYKNWVVKLVQFLTSFMLKKYNKLEIVA